MRHATSAVIIACTAVCAVAGCAPGEESSPASPPPGGGIVWGACDELVAQVAQFSELTGTQSVLDGWEDRLQCGQVSVPLDYTRPGGRQVTVEVSRLLPREDGVGDPEVVLTNPGGPGLEGRTMPALLAASNLGALADDHVIVGVDIRGAGGSTSVDCAALVEVEAPDVEVDESVALSYSRQIATANTECVDSDPDYFAQLTTQNAARDLDRVRAALGVDHVDFFGASWGTELGAAYLTAFPDRVGAHCCWTARRTCDRTPDRPSMTSPPRWRPTDRPAIDRARTG